MRDIVFNGKFRSQGRTGVQRVAHELISATAALKAAKDPTVAPLSLNLALPRGATPLKTPAIRPLMKAKLKGVAWEQAELPLVGGSNLVVNLCNIGALARKGDVTMIHDAQAFISPQSYSKAFGLWYRTALPILARRASRVLTVSDYSRTTLSEAKVAPYDDITVLHNGVDHILRVKADLSGLDILGLRSRPYVLGLSSVQSHKNIRVLLEAATQFQNRDLALVLYGPAGRADFEAAGMKVPPNVILTGRVTDERLRGLIEGARAYLFPSLTEGFGLPPLEAMILGTPAIVAPCGALPELCGTSAVYADETDPDAWAQAINTLVEDERQRLAYAESGRTHAGAYQWSRTASQLAEILRQLA